MNKFIKSFRGFIKESIDTTDPEELKSLLDMGLLEPAELVKHLRQTGISIESVFTQYIQMDSEPEGIGEGEKADLENWIGPRGESLAYAYVNYLATTELTFSLIGLLSNGSSVELRFSTEDSGLDIVAKITEKSGKVYDLEEEDKYYYLDWVEDDGSERIIVTLLDLIVGYTHGGKL